MRRIILWAVVAILVVGGAGYGYWAWTRSADSNESAAAQARSVRIRPDFGPMEEVLSAVGTLEPLTQVDVLARAWGEVSRVPVQEGAMVEAGQLLAALDPTDLQLSVTRARASLLSAQANLRKLQAGPSEAEVLQQRNAVDQARLKVQRLEDQVSQNRVLAGQGALAPSELAQMEDDLASARQDLHLAEQRLAELTAGPDPEDVEVAEAQVAEAEANLAIAQEELRRSEFRSPLAGTVLTVDVEPGESVQEGQVLARVGRLDRMRVTVPVHEIDVNRVKLGQEARVTADAAPERTFRGTVASVATVGNAANGVVSFDVTVEVDNAEGLLRPAMTVDVEIVVDRKEAALRIPLEALFRQNQQDMVLRAGPDGSPVPTVVRVGLRNGRFAEIVQGLSADDTLILQASGLSGATGASGGEGNRVLMGPGMMPVPRR
ncbi:efflux RND transporter periplasmic adaptor subunit [Limnochorda pilosa]|uniref:Uncharacterized protein n=1 Tax=Limnochorda pilosa TaxID=1555112 RepID=A0A0K2SNN2_LIMPI|nr:efflux RND transporter periplasmic adaptor subunit [Limnochorda pilosa]BAS28715.1 hypothetical protein LIP_2886 [Limnochorda pilosa]